MRLMLHGVDDAVGPKQRIVDGPGLGLTAPEAATLQQQRRAGFRVSGGYRVGTRA